MTMFVKPKHKNTVRVPERQFAFLPDEGALVPKNSYWLRRISEGSVSVADAPAKNKNVKHNPAEAN